MVMGDALKDTEDCIVVTLTGTTKTESFQLPASERGRLIAFIKEKQERPKKEIWHGISLQNAAIILDVPIEELLTIAKEQGWEIVVQNGDVELPFVAALRYEADDRLFQSRSLHALTLISEELGLYDLDPSDFQR